RVTVAVAGRGRGRLRRRGPPGAPPGGLPRAPPRRPPPVRVIGPVMLRTTVTPRSVFGCATVSPPRPGTRVQWARRSEPRPPADTVSRPSINRPSRTSRPADAPPGPPPRTLKSAALCGRRPAGTILPHAARLAPRRARPHTWAP